MGRWTGRNEKGELLFDSKVICAGDLYEAASALEEFEDMDNVKSYITQRLSSLHMMKDYAVSDLQRSHIDANIQDLQHIADSLGIEIVYD